jgi:hypothetical protein
LALINPTSYNGKFKTVEIEIPGTENGGEKTTLLVGQQTVCFKKNKK